MFIRIYTLSSTWFYFQDALEEARNILISNQYPPSFVEEIINVTLTKLISVSEEVNYSENETNKSDFDISVDSNTCLQKTPI